MVHRIVMQQTLTRFEKLLNNLSFTFSARTAIHNMTSYAVKFAQKTFTSEHTHLYVLHLRPPD